MTLRDLSNAVGLGAALMFASCRGSSIARPTTTPAALTGTVTDRISDALVVPDVFVSPDLVAGTLEVSAGNLTITVSYAYGTMSQTRTMFFAYLDTDQNPATGNPGVPAVGGVADADLIGSDYAINGVSPADSGRASVHRASGSGSLQTISSVPVIFPGADQIRVVVPLTLLGNDDGRMNFKVICHQWLSPEPPTSTVLDYLPDVRASVGTVR